MDTDGKVLELYLTNEHSHSHYKFEDYETVMYKNENKLN